jgi:hypothetical protein
MTKLLGDITIVLKKFPDISKPLEPIDHFTVFEPFPGACDYLAAY